MSVLRNVHYFIIYFFDLVLYNKYKRKKMYTVDACKSSDRKHAMISITAKSSRTKRTNVVFVIDKSGSMASIIDYVKLIVVQTCKQLPANTFIGLVAFNDEAQIMTTDLLDVSQDVNLDMIDQLISTLTVGGATNMGSALTAGYALLPMPMAPLMPLMPPVALEPLMPPVALEPLTPLMPPVALEPLTPPVARAHRTSLHDADTEKKEVDFVHNTLVLLTDGEATIGICDRVELLQLALSLRKEKNATLFAVAIGKSCDIEFLRRITPSGCLFQVRNNVADVIKGVTVMVGEMAHVALASFVLQVSCVGFDHDVNVISIDRIGCGQSKHFVFTIAPSDASSVTSDDLAPIHVSIKHQSEILFERVVHLSECTVQDEAIFPQLERLRLCSLVQDEKTIELQEFAARFAETLPDLAERAKLAVRTISRAQSTSLLLQELGSQDHVLNASDYLQDELPPRPMFHSQLSRQTSETIHNAVLQRMQSAPTTMSIPQQKRHGIYINIPDYSDNSSNNEHYDFIDHDLCDDDGDGTPLPLPPPLMLYRQ